MSTDPRIAKVQHWFVETLANMRAWGDEVLPRPDANDVEELLDTLDSAPPQDGDVERAARAIYIARYGEPSDIMGIELQPWEQVDEHERDDYREEARAALHAVAGVVNERGDR